VAVDDSELRDLDPFDLLDAEAARLDGFFAELDDEGWKQPTRCAGWRRREMLAHLAGSEVYNRASLDGEVSALLKRAADAGVTDVDGFNDWMVREREDSEAADVLAEWREANADVRRRLRQRGWEARIDTMVGPYPAGLQAFHLASELAVHADDMAVPVTDQERRSRSAWRARFARFAVREANRPVQVEARDGRNQVTTEDGVVAELDDVELVEAAQARIGPDQVDARVLEALRALV